MITGLDPAPAMVGEGAVMERADLRTTHECNHCQQMFHLAPEGVQSIRVIADDIDAHALFRHVIAHVKLYDVGLSWLQPAKEGHQLTWQQQRIIQN